MTKGDNNIVKKKKRGNNIKEDIITSQNNKTPQASKDVEMEILFDAVKTEYEHCIRRSEKLDNKIYILLTVCAFLFVMLSDIIKTISNISFPNNCCELSLVIIFSILLLTAIVLFSVMLVYLASLLKPVFLSRLKSKEILKEDLIILPSETSFRTVCILYEQSIERNDTILEKKFNILKKCIDMMIALIIDLIVLAVLCQLV